MQAATAKAWCVHSIGLDSSLLLARYSFKIVLEAARQVRRVNAKTGFVKLSPRSFLEKQDLFS